MSGLPTVLEQLRALIHYDPETGFFTNKETGERIEHQAGQGYLGVRALGRGYKAHRLAWYLTTGEWPKNQVDHINQIKTDNRAVNLRDVTAAENAQNNKWGRTITGMTGVYQSRHGGSYRAAIVVNGRFVQLGVYSTMEEARDRYAEAKEYLLNK